MRLRRDDSFLLVVDVQQKLAPHVEGHERVTRKCAALIEAARKLDIPLLVSEHCPHQIGATVSSLRALVKDSEVKQKSHFACTDEPEVLAALRSMHRRQAVVAGMEAHVCVMQTALGLAERGFYPFLVGDAVGSRREEDRAAAIERVRAAGCAVTSAEMTIFEWMGRADIPEFRDLLKTVKSL
jgi:nicotinamidase-related amidase